MTVVKDPVFPRGRGEKPPGAMALTYDFAKISPEMHDIERIWTGEGHTSLVHPLRSAIGLYSEVQVEERLDMSR